MVDKEVSRIHSLEKMGRHKGREGGTPKRRVMMNNEYLSCFAQVPNLQKPTYTVQAAGDLTGMNLSIFRALVVLIKTVFSSDLCDEFCSLFNITE